MTKKLVGKKAPNFKAECTSEKTYARDDFNGKKARHGFYEFDVIDVISAGVRDPDAEGAEMKTEVAIEYGTLFEVFLDFIIVGLTVFIVVKAMNRLRHKAQDAKDTTVATPKDIELLSKLTDLMEEQNKLLKNQNS